MTRMLIKGCEAIGEAAVRAGCKLFFGYPITPQNEIPEYLAKRLPQVGGCFVQAESEVAAANMIYGAASAGARVLTSSSSPGISLMMEGLSYLAGAELPCVIVNIMRAGPGLGGILPSQSDYFQATKGGGHGDYHCLTLAPWSVQEAADLVQDAFDLADYYRSPTLVLGDGLIGQMMEPCEFNEARTPLRTLPPKDWATTGNTPGRKRAIITSLHLDPDELERHTRGLAAKYAAMARDDTRIAIYGDDDDSDLLIVAYGTVARVCSSARDNLRAQGIRVTLARPITLFPFPYAAVRAAAERSHRVLVIELSAGQMLEDVRLAVAERRPIDFYGRMGGNVVSPEEIVDVVKELLNPTPARTPATAAAASVASTTAATTAPTTSLTTASEATNAALWPEPSHAA